MTMMRTGGLGLSSLPRSGGTASGEACSASASAAGPRTNASESERARARAGTASADGIARATSHALMRRRDSRSPNQGSTFSVAGAQRM